MSEQATSPAPAPVKDDEAEGDFVCPACSRWFGKRSKRLAHMARSHPEVTLR